MWGWLRPHAAHNTAHHTEPKQAMQRCQRPACAITASSLPLSGLFVHVLSAHRDRWDIVTVISGQGYQHADTPRQDNTSLMLQGTQQEEMQQCAEGIQPRQSCSDFAMLCHSHIS